jgi:hypothetical protein
MRSGIWQGGALHLVAGVLLGVALVGRAGAADLREFIHETQQSVTVGQQLTMAWWIPPEFWDLSLAANSNVSPENAAEVRNAFHDYQVFAVVRANVGLQGLTGAASKTDLVANSHFQIGGKAIQPIEPDKVPTGVQTLLGAMRPMIGSMLGQLGQSMELIVFPAVVDGQRLNDPVKPGAFQFAVYDQTFHWRTPLASLLPKKLDPKTNEEFPGNYLYNPYTGDKLRAK